MPSRRTWPAAPLMMTLLGCQSLLDFSPRTLLASSFDGGTAAVDADATADAESPSPDAASSFCAHQGPDLVLCADFDEGPVTKGFTGLANAYGTVTLDPINYFSPPYGMHERHLGRGAGLDPGRVGIVVEPDLDAMQGLEISFRAKVMRQPPGDAELVVLFDMATAGPDPHYCAVGAAAVRCYPGTLAPLTPSLPNEWQAYVARLTFGGPSKLSVQRDDAGAVTVDNAVFASGAGVQVIVGTNNLRSEETFEVVYDDFVVRAIR